MRENADESEFANLFIPLIFHNDGTRHGMITKIEISFRDGITIKKLPIISKIKLNQLDKDHMNQGRQAIDAVDFDEIGYTVQVPTYPISVPAGESTEAIFYCCAYTNDKILPIDKQLECSIRIEYNGKRINQVSFPFILTSEDYDGTINLRWFKPEPGNMREQFPGDYEE